MKRLLSGFLALLLLLAALPAIMYAEEAAYETQAYGDKGDAVREIQTRLSELGYYTGKITGNFLEGTRAGLRRFQKDHDLKQTGEADKATYDLLMAAQYRNLKNGDDGADVGDLQDRLIELGYLDSKITEKYRAMTEGAVKAFQRQNGLEVTGEADMDMQKLLFSALALPNGAQPTPTPDPATDLGDVNDVLMVDDGASTQDTLDETTPFGKRLTRGSEGANVKKVQTRLTELGFFDGPLSGYYMDQTIAAVKAFQGHNGLEADGVMGEETWNALFNAADVVNASATPKPTPVPTPIPYALTVDVKNQVTTVYGLDENGEYTEVVRQMICSTGMVGTPSDVGEWVTDGRRARWAFFSLYGSHAQYWTKINENIAFHSVIYRAVDYMALSRKSYNLLGSRASHGCIRLLVSDAKWIYENVRKGTTVTINEDLPRDQELVKSLAPPPLNTKYMVPATTPEPTPAPAYQSDGMPPQPFRKLQQKSKGADVYWLQMKLKELGYYTGTVTGEYWSGTAAAVRAFQKANKISGGGVATVKTQEALYADVLAKNTPTPTPAPTPSPTK